LAAIIQASVTSLAWVRSQLGGAGGTAGVEVRGQVAGFRRHHARTELCRLGGGRDVQIGDVDPLDPLQFGRGIGRADGTQGEQC
jgi:hypothetical protein